MSRRERDIAPYPRHMTGILGPIEKYHLKDSWLQKFFKNLKKRGPPLNAPMHITSAFSVS